MTTLCILFVLLATVLLHHHTAMADDYSIPGCGECPAGNCTLIQGKPVIDFGKPLPYDENTHLFVHENFQVQIIRGTRNDWNDPKRILLGTYIDNAQTGYDPSHGCFVIGLSDGTTKAGVEQYAILDVAKMNAKCEKVFGFPFDVATKVRGWQVSKDACPKGTVS